LTAKSLENSLAELKKLHEDKSASLSKSGMLSKIKKGHFYA
jgi:hypothetical protein